MPHPLLTKPKQHWISSSLQHPRHAVHDAADDEGGDGGAEEGEGLGGDSIDKVQLEYRLDILYTKKSSKICSLDTEIAR